MIEINILTPCSPSKDPLCSFILQYLNKTAYDVNFNIELGNACTRSGAEEKMTKRGAKRSVSSLFPEALKSQTSPIHMYNEALDNCSPVNL